MKLYIDIDGVLLTKKQDIPKYGIEFIKFVTTYFDCYWLTTHCHAGGNMAINYLNKYYSSDTINELLKVKSTDWMDKKTEGIDFESEFVWLDDFPFHVEKEVLLKENKYSSLIVVNLDRENELLNVKKELEKRKLLLDKNNDNSTEMSCLGI